MAVEGSQPLTAGAAQVDVSPRASQFLFGYPHVERYSTGIHDPLWSSALYLSDGRTRLLFIGNDVIFVGKGTVERVRRRIREATGVPEEAVMITATHTHSGPATVDYVNSSADEAVPLVDPVYLELLENGMVEAAGEAVRRARPAAAGFAAADAAGVGTNRRDPSGPSDPEVPVLMVREAGSGKPMAGMLVCSMHPTVLHEDSRLVSGDFPGLARIGLQRDLLGGRTPVIYHTGPAGNQSPRHAVRTNTFEEAERLGGLLAESVLEAVNGVEYRSSLSLSCRSRDVDLPRRVFPDVAEARRGLEAAREKLDRLRRGGASRQACRTAECDWFGAEEIVVLAQAAERGRLDPFYASCLPAEIQISRLGPWTYVGWPGELFVEYGLAVKRRFADTYVISLANGDLQGYVVTEEAAREGGYEASNALFGPQAGEVLVRETLSELDAAQSEERGAARPD